MNTNHIPEWDKEEVWQDIENELDRNKRKKRGLFFFLFGIAFLLIGYTYHELNIKNNRPVEIADYVHKVDKQVSTNTELSAHNTVAEEQQQSKSPEPISSIPKIRKKSSSFSKNILAKQNKINIEAKHDSKTNSTTISESPKTFSKIDKKTAPNTTKTLTQLALLAPKTFQVTKKPLLLMTPRLSLANSSKGDKNGNLSLNMSYMLGFSQQYLSGSGYAMSKAKNEKMGVSQMLQLSYNFPINTWLSASSGLAYERLDKFMNFQHRRKINSFYRNSDKAYVNSKAANPSYYPGKVLVNTFEETSIAAQGKHERAYAYLGANLNLSSMMKLRTGFLYNFLRKDEGYFIDQENNLIHKEDISKIKAQYHRKVHRGLLGASMPIFHSSNLDASLLANYMFDLRSHLDKTVANERFTSFYVGCHLKYQFR